jgi:hypothetical protein
VTDAQANAWFDLMPPARYWEAVYNYIQKSVDHLTVDLRNHEIPATEIKPTAEQVMPLWVG